MDSDPISLSGGDGPLRDRYDRWVFAMFMTFMLLTTFSVSARSAGGQHPNTRILLPDLITEDTYFGPGDYELEGMTVIDYGVSVTFDHGARIHVEPGYAENGITVRGNLFMNGSKASNVFFGSSGADPEPDDWYGVIVPSPGVLKATYTLIRDARMGIQIFPGARVDVKDSHINNCSLAGVYLVNFKVGESYQCPVGIKVNSTLFVDNQYGIIENGIDSMYYQDRFIRNRNAAVVFGYGISPYCRHINMWNCHFYDNYWYSLLLNGSADSVNIEDVYVSSCSFRTTNINGYMDVASYGKVRGFKMYYSALYRDKKIMERITIKDAIDCIIRGNDIYGGIEEDYQEAILLATTCRNLTIWFNRFYGADPYEGNTRVVHASGCNGLNISHNRVYHNSNRGIFAYNCTDVAVMNNTIEKGKYAIYMDRTIPNLVSGNIITDARGSGILLSAGILSREDLVPIIERNTIERAKTGIGLGAMEDVWLERNTINGSHYAFSVSSELADVSVLADNCTVTNCSGSIVYMHNYMENCTMTMVNTSLPHYEVRMEGRAGYRCDLFIGHLFKVRATNELWNPVPFQLTVSNDSDPLFIDDVFEGSTPLLKGPFFHFFADDPYELDIEDPNSTVCSYTATHGSGHHEGVVNISGYREIDLVLDQLPIVRETEFHVWEDVGAEISPFDVFRDLDDITMEVTGNDGNITFDGWNVINAAENWTGVATAQVVATDTMGNRTNATIEVHVDPVNDLPVVDPPIPPITIDEDTSTWIGLSSHIKDGDGDEIGLNVGTYPNVTLELNGTDRYLTIIPDPDWFGSMSFNVHIWEVRSYDDDGGGIIPPPPYRIHLDVLPVNDPPRFDVPVGWNITVERGELRDIDLSGMIGDVDDGELVLTTDHDHASITGNILRVLFPLGSNATLAALTLVLTDPQGASDTAQLMVYITDPPSPEWEVTSASVTLDGGGNWLVDVWGSHDIEVHMVIQGAGSFALEESPATPGYYSIRIDADRFEEGVTYGYHFSDSPNGPDRAPSWSGTITQPGAEEDDEEKFGEYYLICIACGAVPLVLLIAFVFFASRGGRKVSEE